MPELELKLVGLKVGAEQPLLIVSFTTANAIAAVISADAKPASQT